jgi:hypothetical protein
VRVNAPTHLGYAERYCFFFQGVEQETKPNFLCCGKAFAVLRRSIVLQSNSSNVDGLIDANWFMKKPREEKSGSEITSVTEMQTV